MLAPFFAEAMLRRGGGFMRRVTAMASVSCSLHARNPGLVVPSLRAAVVRDGRGKHGFPLGKAGAWLPHSREKRCAMI
jgi:hypothetical protein